MSGERPELLTFGERYFERIWGGRRLSERLGRPVPPGKVIGEAWLISDHDECQSVVDTGPWAGKTLGQIMAEHPEYLLGTRVSATPDGQFPLLLKLIDAGEALSVQVHPDDETAQRLDEPDVGKTEMWHVIEADPGAELVCGLLPGTTRESFAAALAEGRVDRCMTRFPAPAGTSVFVPAGTVHAIGGGILLAEIQQNSNITYRVHDWNRLDARGEPRQLHLDKAMEAIDFDTRPAGPSQPVTLITDGRSREALSACRYFAAERVEVAGTWTRGKGTGSFHLVVAVSAGLTVLAGDSHTRLKPGAAVLVPGGIPDYAVEGTGAVLVYYVPDFNADILEQFVRTRMSRLSPTPWLHLSEWDIPEETIALINHPTARRYEVIPLGIRQDIAYIATAAPEDRQTADTLRQMLDMPVTLVGVAAGEVAEALDRYYGPDTGMVEAQI